MKNQITVKSIEELSAINDDCPLKIEADVYVAEWFYDWIFETKSFKEFKHGYELMVRFTCMYEGLRPIESMRRIDDNLRYWFQRASKNSRPFKKYFNKLLILNYGYD